MPLNPPIALQCIICLQVLWNIPEPTWQKFEVPAQNPSLDEFLQQFKITFTMNNVLSWTSFIITHATYLAKGLTKYCLTRIFSKSSNVQATRLWAQVWYLKFNLFEEPVKESSRIQILMNDTLFFFNQKQQ